MTMLDILPVPLEMFNIMLQRKMFQMISCSKVYVDFHILLCSVLQITGYNRYLVANLFMTVVIDTTT